MSNNKQVKQELSEEELNEKICVRATSKGFCGGARRRAGDIFYVPRKVLLKSRWLQETTPTLASELNEIAEEAATTKKKAEQEALAAKAAADQAAATDKLEATKKAQDAQKEADARAVSKRASASAKASGVLSKASKIAADKSSEASTEGGIDEDIENENDLA